MEAETKIAVASAPFAAVRTAHVPVQVGSSAADIVIKQAYSTAVSLQETAYVRPHFVKTAKAPHLRRAGNWYLVKGSMSPVYCSLSSVENSGRPAYHQAHKDWRSLAWPSALDATFACSSLEEDGGPDAGALNAWGVPPSVCTAYEAEKIISLHGWQQHLLQQDRYAALRGCNLVYSAPTGGGKTLIAEILMLRNVLMRRKKALFVVPLVSVCMEKLMSLQRIFASLRLRIAGFYQNTTCRSMAGVDIAVATIERAHSLVNRLAVDGRLSDLGCVIMDEVHLLADPSRGPIVEMLLMKILAHSPRRLLHLSGDATPDDLGCPAFAQGPDDIQLICMSATVSNINQLGQWLHASVVVESTRQIRLDQFVCVDGVIYNEDFNAVRCLKGNEWRNKKIASSSDIFDGVSSDPPLGVLDTRKVEEGCLCIDEVRQSVALKPGCSYKIVKENPRVTSGDCIAALVLETIMCDGNVLVFVKTRDQASGFAVQLHEILLSVMSSCPDYSLRLKKTLEHRERVMDQLRLTPCGVDVKLAPCIVNTGVAFHHAGLTAEERVALEQAFRNKHLFVLVSTTTLGVGVNLPARRVIFDDIREATRSMLYEGKYKQMAGRAGRLGLDDAGQVYMVLPEMKTQVSRNLTCAPFNDPPSAETGSNLSTSTLPVDPLLVHESLSTVTYDPYYARPGLRSVRAWRRHVLGVTTRVGISPFLPWNAKDSFPLTGADIGLLGVPSSAARLQTGAAAAALLLATPALSRDGQINPIEWACRLMHCDNSRVRSAMLNHGRSGAMTLVPLRQAVLELICCNFSGSHRSFALKHVRSLSFFGITEDTASIDEHLEAALVYLMEHRFVETCGLVCKLEIASAAGATPEIHAASRCYHATQLGRATFLSTMSPEDALGTVAELERAMKNGICIARNEFDPLFLLCPLDQRKGRPEEQRALFQHLLGACKGFSDHGSRLISEHANAHEAGSAPATREGVPRKLNALILALLVRDYSIGFIEAESSHILPLTRGDIQIFQRTAATRAAMVCTLCRELNWELLYVVLAEYATRIDFGVEPKHFPLMRIEGISARMARQLFEIGITTPEEVAAADVNDMERALLDCVPYTRDDGAEATTSKRTSVKCSEKATFVASVLIRNAKNLLSG